jgi:hypothetical protein
VARARAVPRSRAAGAALLLVLLAACAAPRRREPPEPALRIWTPGVVHWSAGRRDFALAIENGTSRTVEVEQPSARRARVVLFDGAGADRACGHDADGEGPAGAVTSIAPGDSRAVRVDLEAACGALPPGEYRYEVGYEAPAVGPGPSVRLRAGYGHVVVSGTGAASLDRGSMGSGGSAGDGAEGPGARPHAPTR